MTIRQAFDKVLTDLQLTPEEARYGNCDAVARAVVNALGRGTVGESPTHGHFFFYRDALYYDSPHLGVEGRLSALFNGIHPGRVIYWTEGSDTK